MSETKYFKHFISSNAVLEMNQEQFEQDLRNDIRISSNHALNWKRMLTADTTYYYFYSKYNGNVLIIYSIENPLN